MQPQGNDLLFEQAIGLLGQAELRRWVFFNHGYPEGY